MDSTLNIDVAIIGAGPAGLMAAESLIKADSTLRVTVFEAMPSAARKFLMAGRGGLNLTHSEPYDRFMTRYGAAQPWLQPSVDAFPPQALRDWCDGLQQPTFVGSSGRVFPVALKASPLLRQWLRALDGLGVELKLKHRWLGWNTQGDLLLQSPDGERVVKARATVLALGGASWPRLGSDGGWAKLLQDRGVAIAPFQPANSGFDVPWSDVFRDRFEGQPLKGAALTFNGHTVRSEAMITRAGIEGGGIYALSADLRDAVLAQGQATLSICLQPDIARAQLLQRLAAPRGKTSMTGFLRKALRLSPIAIGLLQEAAHLSGKTLGAMSADQLADLMQAVPIRLTGVAPIERAISSAGGVMRGEVDDQLMLGKIPGTFVAGEMLDWEAPTGGYLLQASFATGRTAGLGALKWLAR